MIKTHTYQQEAEAALSITGFSHNAGTPELGQIVNDLTLNWAYNKEIVSQQINQNVGDIANKQQRSIVLTGVNISNDKTYELQAYDGLTTKVRTTPIQFNNRVLFGSAIEMEDFTNASLFDSLDYEATRKRDETYTIDCQQNQHIYICIPQSLGAATAFQVGIFQGGIDLAGTGIYTNPYGYTETHNVYMSANHSLGLSEVEVF